MFKAALVGLSLILAGCAAAPRVQIPAAAARPVATPMTDAAVSMLGQPYRYGGAAPGGFDCSGLVEYSARRAGLTVPRTAAQQLKIGTRVARQDMRAGDLVFMHLARKELHVGIAVDDRHFVHAPSAGGLVRIDALDSAPYARGFLQIRRLTTTP